MCELVIKIQVFTGEERNEDQAFGKILFGSFMNKVLYKGTPY